MDRIMLLGRDHTELGATALDRLGSGAIALSRGRHPKAYPYLEPNEDAVVAAVSDDLVVLAVADGHAGTEASHLVIETINDALSNQPRHPPDELVRSLVEQSRQALSAARPPDEARPGTTLTVLAATTDQGATAGWGDSVAALIRRKRGRSLNQPQALFAYSGEDAPLVAQPVRFRIRPADTLLVASDGLTDFVVQPWAATLAGHLGHLSDPKEVVEAAIAAAGAGGAGDNVAVGAFCVGN